MVVRTDNAEQDLRIEVEDFYTAYASAIDQRRPNDWVALFAADGVYSVTSYGNHTGQGMRWFTDVGQARLAERAAVTHGYLWGPQHKTLHMITNVRSRSAETDQAAAHAYFAVFVTTRSGESSLHVCGEFHDRLVRGDGKLYLAEHLVVVDAETLPPNLGILL